MFIRNSVKVSINKLIAVSHGLCRQSLRHAGILAIEKKSCVWKPAAVYMNLSTVMYFPCRRVRTEKSRTLLCIPPWIFKIS